jgi:hypothetical protein
MNVAVEQHACAGLSGGTLPRALLKAAIAGAAILLAACQVRVDSPGAAPIPTPTGTGGVIGGGPGAGGGTGSGLPQALDCKDPHAAPSRLRLLSASQYNNTVLDLLQVGGDPAQDFGDKVFEQLDDTRVEQRANAAADVARQAVAILAKWSPCLPPATGSAVACEQQIIDKVGASAFRRPLTAVERTQLKALFDAGITERDFPTGVEWFLTGLLQAPDFIYEIVKPAPNEVVGQVRPLDPFEYASRLSYFLWSSLPDDNLLAAAAANELGAPDKRQAQLIRMLEDPRFMRGVEAFYGRWLNLAAFNEVARDVVGFTGDVVRGLSTSLLMSATQLYSVAAPNFSGLFSGESYYMNDAVRGFYGVAGSGTAFTAVTMSGESRRGILTHPALMAMLARPKESFPIARGLFVLRKFLCMEVAPPPAGLAIPELPPIQEGLSTRDRLEAHTSNPFCNGCHKVFDPPGFALENFDEVGRYRTMDHGKPVNTSGTIELGRDLDGPFAKGDDLLAKMSSSPDVRGCFAEQYLRFALSRDKTDPADACSVNQLRQTFAPSGDLKQLMVSIVASDAFRLRIAEGVAP